MVASVQTMRLAALSTDSVVLAHTVLVAATPGTRLTFSHVLRRQLARATTSAWTR
jgi:hypothetical protein